ncbi:O-antigen ligase family protein [Dinoroseobacter shibae]|uniref:O-antigen ligase family protein n=1 Tax=Dinoroseobacter shibae TaxID=215813 RepID=UPI0030ED76B7
MLVTLALVAICIPVQFAAGPLVLSPIRFLLLICTVPLFIRLVTGSYGRILFVDVLIVAHVVWQLVAMLHNNPESAVQFVGSNGLEFLGAYLVARCGIRNRDDFVAFIKLFMLLILLLMPFAMIETQTARPVIPDLFRSLGLQGLTDVRADKRLGLERAQVVFPHPIHYGLFCSTALALVYLGLQDRMPRPKRIMLAFAIIISTVMSVSSGALLPLMIQISLIAWAGITHRTKYRWWLLIAILAPCYLLLEIISDRPAHIALLSHLTFNAHNVYWRTIIFDYGMLNVWANPIFGLGLKDWVRPSFMHSGSMDNFWLLNAVRFGVPGFLTVAGAFAIALFRIMHLRFPTDHPLRQIRLAYVVGMISLLLTLCTVHVWGPVYSLVMLFMGSGIWLITADTAAETFDETSATEPARPQSRYTRFATQTVPKTSRANAGTRKAAAVRSRHGTGASGPPERSHRQSISAGRGPGRR